MSKANCTNCGAHILQKTFDEKGSLCAPCYKKKIEKEQYEKFMSIPGCPSCDGSGIIAFSWRDAHKNKKGKNHKYISYICKRKDVKFGTIYQCNICGIYWWLGDKYAMIHMLKPEKMPLISKWSEKKYTIPFGLYRKAFNIKPTPDTYGERLENIAIPCSIVTTDLIEYQKVLIKITRWPPLFESVDKVLFADQIKELKPSPYALPFTVREATSRAKEVRMCFYPTMVESKDGKKFILNNTCNFFDYMGIQGKDIILPKNNIDSESSFQSHQYYKPDRDDIYYVYLDLDWLQKIYTIACS